MRFHLSFAILLLPSLALAKIDIAPEISTGLGVNIHFTTPRPGEMEQIAAAGFKFVRMDFTWSATEKSPGKYDFTAYDRLLSTLEPHGIRAIFILDYSNRAYDDDLSPHTDEGRKAFARWAVAAAQHFKGRKILWEMYNEPNIHFWRPKPDTDDYIKLALEVGEAFRKQVPDETYIGPACSTFDMPFLEACFKAGLLDYWSAVSVHPYRSREPESAAEDYVGLRALIAKHAPKGKSIPILSGEWGYSTHQIDDARQGNFIARQWLMNLANDVPLSIWYDWHDDGTDPNEPEHHFGTVTNDYKPKPSYLAARMLTTQLAGFVFNKQLRQKNSDDFVLLFSKGETLKIVAWTSAPEPRTIVLPAAPGTFDLSSHVDDKPKSLQADANGLSVTLAQHPQFIAPHEPDVLLSKIAAWKRAPLEVRVRRQEKIQLPGAQIDVGRFTVTQPCRLIITNPLNMTLMPPNQNRATVRIDNPSGEPFRGRVAIGNSSEPVTLQPKQTDAIVTVPTPPNARDIAAELLDDAGNQIAAIKYRFEPIDFSAEKFTVHAEGDPKLESTESLAVSPDEQRPSLRLTYRFRPGWKYLCVAPEKRNALKVDGKPKYLGLWVKGDGSQNLMRMRFVDSTNQFFQPDGGRIDFNDWRFIRFDLSNPNGHWAGAKDGVIHYPIRINTVFLLDSKSQSESAGAIDVSAPVLIYED